MYAWIRNHPSCLLSETTGLWFAIAPNRQDPWLIDAATGERLLSSSEVEAAQRAAEERAACEAKARQVAEEARQTAEERAAMAEERANRETEARQAAEDRAAREAEARQAAEAELARLREKLGLGDPQP